MQELEVKILEIDKNKIIEKLESLNAVKVFDGSIEAEFYFINGKKIRLRKMGNKNIITFKESLENEFDGVMANKEYETVFGDYEIMSGLLTGIGCEKYGGSKKHRTTYSLGEITYDLDSFPGIPDFMEIEAETQELVEKGVELIGYNMKDTVCMGERKLKEFYNIA